jgi:transposase
MGRQMKKEPGKYPRLIRIFVDGGFSGEGFLRLGMDTFGFILKTVLRSVGVKGVEVLPKRWVVERTFGWFNYWRRLRKEALLNQGMNANFAHIHKLA